MNILEILFYQPVFNITIIFYRLLGDNLGLAIIAVGLVFRFLMVPLMLKQLKMMDLTKEMQEKTKAIKNKFKKNKEKQQQELLKLQQEYLPAQISGCLPMIFQFIIFIILYNIIRDLVSVGVEGFNRVAYSFVPQFPEGYTPNTSFFNVIDLKASPGDITEMASLIPYLVLVLLVGITQYFSIKIMTSLRPKVEEKKPKKKKDADAPEDFAEIMQRSTKQIAFLFPIFLMFISYGLPSGISIYLITTSLFVILQQLIFAKIKQNNKN